MKRNMLAVFATSVALSSFLAPVAPGQAEAAANPKGTALAAAQQSTTASSAKLVVDNHASTIRTFKAGGTTLYSIRDLASAWKAEVVIDQGFIYVYAAQSAHTVRIQLNSYTYQADGATHQFSKAPVVSKGSVYAELDALVSALGGERVSASELQYASMKKLDGEFSAPRWNAAGHLVVTRSSDEGIETVSYNPVNGSYEHLTANEDAEALAVSPNGLWGAFTNGEGQLYLLDLASGRSQALGTDNSVKTDLIWSQDSSKLYFMQGDKQEKIAYVSLKDAKVTTIVNDKVENKGSLRLSADGNMLLYSVSITGVAKNDADSTEDSLTIDYSNAWDQLYMLDVSKKDAKPVQLTTSKDNKLYPILLSNGNVIYVSAEVEGTSNASLKLILAADLKVTSLVSDIDVSIAALTSAGKILIAGTDQAGNMNVYEVATDGKKSLLYSTAGAITELMPAANGSGVAAIEDGKAIVITGGKAVVLTK